MRHVALRDAHRKSAGQSSTSQDEIRKQTMAIKYDSPRAQLFARLGRLSWFGFLGCLGFLGFLGFVPGWERLFGLSGLSGFSGLFGLAACYDIARRIEARHHGNAGCT
jgi:hypothetical protein